MWQIQFYEDHRGKSPPLDYINGLSPRDRVKVNNVLRLLEEFGTALGMPHGRRIEGRLWELRPGDNRLFYFLFSGKQFVIFMAFVKRPCRRRKRKSKLRCVV